MKILGAAFLWLLLCTQSFAAFVHVQGIPCGACGFFGSAASFSPPAFSAPVGSGNCVMGGVTFTTVSATSIAVTDDKANTYNVGTFINTAGLVQSDFWLCNITNGPTVLTVTPNASGGNWVVVADEFSGAKVATNPSDGEHGQIQVSPGTGTDGVTSGNITTTVNGDLIFGITFDTGGTTLSTVGTGYTQGTTYNAVITGVVSEYKTQGSAGAVAATYTQGANNPAATFVIAIQPPGGAAAVPYRALIGVGQ